MKLYFYVVSYKGLLYRTTEIQPWRNVRNKFACKI
jgi:hypothetical protein